MDKPTPKTGFQKFLRAMRFWRKIFPDDEDVSSILSKVKQSLNIENLPPESKTQANKSLLTLGFKLFDALVPFNTFMRVLTAVVTVAWIVMLVLISVYTSNAILISHMTVFVDPAFKTIMQYYFISAGVNGAIRTAKAP